jgi:hypothetical protein
MPVEPSMTLGTDVPKELPDIVNTILLPLEVAVA